MVSISAEIFLSVFLFYYIGRALLPEMLGGKLIYLSLVAMTLPLLLLKILISGKIATARINLVTLFFGTIVCALYLVFNFVLEDARRFETSFTQYFGVFLFFLFFYFLRSFVDFRPGRATTTIILLVSIEIFIEASLILLHRSDLLIHYDAVSIANFNVYGELPRIIGLMGNRSNTAVFLVVLYWLHMGFRDRNNLKPDLLVGLLTPAFLLCTSGTGFAVLVVSLSLYRRKNLKWLLPLFLVGGLLLEGVSVIYVNKLTLSYFAMILQTKLSYFTQFFNQLFSLPSILVFGAPTKFGFSLFADTSVIKSVTDFGLWPILFNLFLIRETIGNFRQSSASQYQIRCIRIGLVSLFLGTIHYPVLFAFPTQALLGALAAHSFYVRTKRDSLKTPPSDQRAIHQPLSPSEATFS